MISVIVPVYNKEKYLFNTLSSLDKQTTDDFEIVIIDDKSTDNSLKIIREFKENTKKQVKVLRCNNNLGVSEARNIGVKEASGNYLTFLDADDYLDKNFIKIANAKLKKYSNIDVIRGEIITIKDNKKSSIEGNYHLRNNQIIIPRKNRYYIICEGASCNGKIYHSSLVNNIGFNNSGFEDYEFTLEMMINCNEMLNVKNMKYYYNIIKDGRYKLEQSKIKENCLDYINIHEKMDEEYNLSPFLSDALRLRKIKACLTYLRNVKDLNMLDSDKKLFINLYLTYLKSHDGLDYLIIGDGRDIINPNLFKALKINNDYEKIKEKIKQIASKY